MERISEYKLKGDAVLITVNGYRGEDDFYAMYNLIREIVSPDHITFGVDSLCVDGSFRKGDILVRISSESAYDFCCFLYDAASLSEAQLAQVHTWIEEVAARLYASREPHFDIMDDEY